MPFVTYTDFDLGPRTAALCDACGPAWAAGLTPTGDDFAFAGFTDAAHARRVLALFGWTITESGAWCESCAARFVCEREGHHWEDLADDGTTGLLGEPLPPVRHCLRCGHHIPLTAAHGHGREQLPGGLTAEEQAALARLELDLKEHQ